MKDVIDRALYGVPEIKPEERGLFLSTIIERIYLALTKKQVIRGGMYEEAIRLMKTKQNLHLYINGNLAYKTYSNYIQEASKHNCRFTVVTPPRTTPFGLVLADESSAIESTNMFVKDELYQLDMEEIE